MKQSMILLHGLFGALSNWGHTITHFEAEYDIHVPELPIYDNYKGNGLAYLSDFLETYIATAKLENVILIGNSLGGHLAILYAHRYPEKVSRLVLTGSSGLYENTSMGGFVKRSNYNYIRERVAYTFYDPAIATDMLVEEVLNVTANRQKSLSVLKMAKSAQRNYVASILPDIATKTLLVWGAEDKVTPPHVALEFERLLPNAQLIMFPHCGHAPMMEQPVEFNRVVGLFLK